MGNVFNFKYPSYAGTKEHITAVHLHNENGPDDDEEWENETAIFDGILIHDWGGPAHTKWVKEARKVIRENNAKEMGYK